VVATRVYFPAGANTERFTIGPNGRLHLLYQSFELRMVTTVGDCLYTFLRDCFVLPLTVMVLL